MLKESLEKDLFRAYPAPWSYNEKDGAIIDATGRSVIADGTGAFIAFDSDEAAAAVVLWANEVAMARGYIQ